MNGSRTGMKRSMYGRESIDNDAEADGESIVFVKLL
jgi:hypothetical protein